MVHDASEHFGTNASRRFFSIRFHHVRHAVPFIVTIRLAIFSFFCYFQKTGERLPTILVLGVVCMRVWDRCVSRLVLIGLISAGCGSSANGQSPVPRLPWTQDQAKTVQTDAAKAVGRPLVFQNVAGMNMVFIPGGQFEIGPNGSKRRVRLKHAFHIGQTEVTLGQFRKWKPDHKVAGSDAEFNENDRPVAFVSWREARAFCDWLSEHPEEKKAGRVYGLPTEAEWEWAARAGTLTTRYFGDTDKGQTETTWFNSTYTPNPKHESSGRGRQQVARLRPNAWGLFDVLGNVWEWCEDHQLENKWGESRDPVLRGGSWRSGAFHCTAVAHDPGHPDQKADNIGFRVVCRFRPIPR